MVCKKDSKNLDNSCRVKVAQLRICRRETVKEISSWGPHKSVVNTFA